MDKGWLKDHSTQLAWSSHGIQCSTMERFIQHQTKTKNLHAGLLEENKQSGKKMRIAQDWKKTEKICFNIVADLFHFFRHHLTTFTHLQDSYHDISRDCVFSGNLRAKTTNLNFRNIQLIFGVRSLLSPIHSADASVDISYMKCSEASFMLLFLRKIVFLDALASLELVMEGHW